MSVFRIIAAQNADYDLLVTWKDSTGSPINLTGFTAALQVRLTYGEATTVISLTNGSGLTLGGAAGTIAIHIPYSLTAPLQAPKGYVYDLRVASGSGAATRILEGELFLSPTVTR